MITGRANVLGLCRASGLAAPGAPLRLFWLRQLLHPGLERKVGDMSNVFIKFSLPVLCYLQSRAVAVTTGYMKEEFIQSPKDRATADPNNLLRFKEVRSGFFND